jgi:hypothetical protein
MRLFIVLMVTVFIPSLNGQDLNYARQIVNTLSSPEFSGRGYVDDGHIKAAEYISNEFVRIGIKPFGSNYFQPFKLEVNTFPGEMSLSIDKTKLEPGVDFMVDPSSCSVKGVFPICYIKIQDLFTVESVGKLMQECAGKFVVIDEIGFKAANKEESGKANDLISLFKTNARIKSAGTILLTDQKLSWGVSLTQANKPTITISKNIPVKRNSTISINIEADHLTCKTNNVIGYIRGIHQPDSFLVLTAHYDHLGKMGAETYFPGANDNSSGIAMLLNLAEYFNNNPPDYSVVFMAFAGEEAGLVGARYFMSHPLFDPSNIRFLVNFDLAGTGNEGIQVVNGSIYKENFDLLVKLNAEGELLDTVKVRGAACNSDHCVFYEYGVPCFYIYTLGGSRAYHDVYDKPETLPLTEFHDYCKLMIAFLEHL